MLPIPIDRTSGRRSSSIGCRSIVGRRTSIYVTSHSAHVDPFKVIMLSFYIIISNFLFNISKDERNEKILLERIN
jgi:hypothetical protein